MPGRVQLHPLGSPARSTRTGPVPATLDSGGCRLLRVVPPLADLAHDAVVVVQAGLDDEQVVTHTADRSSIPARTL